MKMQAELFTKKNYTFRVKLDLCVSVEVFLWLRNL